MKTRPKGLRYIWLAVCCASAVLVAQDRTGLAPAQMLKPLGESWTSYSGDYSGNRYSALTQVNQANVKTSRWRG